MSLLTVAQVVARSGKAYRSTVIYAIRQGYLNAIKPGREWLIYDDEKLQDYISNPPKRGARKKAK